MSNMTRTIYRRSISNELVDWSNNMSIDIPDTARAVYVDAFTNGGTVASNTYLNMRVNDSTTPTTYNYQRRYTSGTTYFWNTAALNAWSIMRIDTPTTHASFVHLVIYPRISDRYNHGEYERGQINSGTVFMSTGYIRWVNTVSEINSIQLFTGDSVNSSFDVVVGVDL